MTSVLVCAVDAVPCPPESQQWVAVDQAFSPAALGVDALAIAEVFGWGFAAVVLFWSMGYGVGVALKLIRLV